MRAFLTNPALSACLDRAWSPSVGAYTQRVEDHGESVNPTSANLHLLVYHTYCMQLGLAGPHRQRAAALAQWLAAQVREDGLIAESATSVTDHPAHGSSVADALGCYAWYARLAGDPGDPGGPDHTAEAAAAALLRIAAAHPVIRPPFGIQGRTQQLRFESRVFYWAWRLTNDAAHRDAYLQVMQRGIHAYTHAVAMHGGLAQPSLHPDWTWNYACASGTTHTLATNTHTPVYYCTEPQGFVFTYLHALATGALSRNPDWDAFIAPYLQGLLRNLSRAGHTMADVDGYGIHRAWFSACLCESVPTEAAAAAALLDMDPQWSRWFRWYVDRYIDFVIRQPSFASTGLPPHVPYGQRITIEPQFDVLTTARFYALLARGCAEYQLDTLPAQSPPAFASTAWWQQWVRVSTPTYETSFVGQTSGCQVPVVRHFGDPNLGCIHGGAPLATLQVGTELMYATSNDPEGLWHIALTDVNGRQARTCATSFEDQPTLTVMPPASPALFNNDWKPYAPPAVHLLDAPYRLHWTRSDPAGFWDTWCDNTYEADALELHWGLRWRMGYYLRTATFCIPIPADLQPQLQLPTGQWTPATELTELPSWPSAITWRRGQAQVHLSLTSSTSADPAALSAQLVAVPTTPRRPGGENSFCPFPLLQLRLTLAVGPHDDSIALRHRLTFNGPA